MNGLTWRSKAPQDATVTIVEVTRYPKSVVEIRTLVTNWSLEKATYMADITCALVDPQTNKEIRSWAHSELLPMDSEEVVMLRPQWIIAWDRDDPNPPNITCNAALYLHSSSIDADLPPSPPSDVVVLVTPPPLAPEEEGEEDSILSNLEGDSKDAEEIFIAKHSLTISMFTSKKPIPFRVKQKQKTKTKQKMNIGRIGSLPRNPIERVKKQHGPDVVDICPTLYTAWKLPNADQ